MIIVDVQVRGEGPSYNIEVTVHRDGGSSSAEAKGVFPETESLKAGLAYLQRAAPPQPGMKIPEDWPSFLAFFRRLSDYTQLSSFDIAWHRAGQRAMGEILYGFLFQKECGKVVYDLFNREQKEAVSLRLDIGPAALRPHPWELLRSPEARAFLGLRKDYSIARRVHFQSNVPQAPLERPLRFTGLLAFTAADARKGHSVPRIEQTLESALGSERNQERGGVDVTWIKPGSDRRLAEVGEATEDGYTPPPDIFHLASHGHNTDADEGAVYLLDDEGQSKLIPGEMFSTYLEPFQGLGLLMINTCLGASQAAHPAYDTLAQLLCRSRRPKALIAHQRKIRDDDARELASKIYAQLREKDLESLVGRARKTLHQNQSGDPHAWYSPVLYMTVERSDFFVHIKFRGFQISLGSRSSNQSTGTGSPAQGKIDLNGLRIEILNVLYDPMVLRIVVEDAGIPTASVNLDGALESQLFNVLKHAAAQPEHHLLPFLNLVLQRFPHAHLPVTRAHVQKISGKS